MRALWMEPSTDSTGGADAGNGQAVCSAEELSAEGVLVEAIPNVDAAAAHARHAVPRGLEQHEQVELDEADPTHELRLVKESDEHTHLADELRIVLDGTVVYDVRARDGRWMRVWLVPGELILVPAKRYHRVLLGHDRRVRFIQWFSDARALAPLYRASDDATRAV
jgi:1,2-dihydroxy-3-keto-5-methylthiopentene dioxygenase